MADLLRIGQQIKDTRKRLGMSQRELSLKSGVSRARVEALENQRIPDISFKNLLRIMNAVGLDLRATDLNLRRPTLDELTEEEARSR